MQPFANGACGQAEIAGLADHIAQPRFEQAHPGIRRQADTAGLGHRHAHAATAFEHALRFELAVGAADRHGVDGVVLGHLPDRGQTFTHAQLAGRDETAHLLDDLSIDRVGRGGADEEMTCVHVYQ